MDGKVGGVVVTPDKEINAQTAKVLVQRWGMAPEEVEVKRCTVIQLGDYPHPAVYKAQDDVQIARMCLSQKGIEPSKLKNLNLPKVPFLPVLWDGEEKVSWFSDLVKFRHRYQNLGETTKIRDREILNALAASWEAHGKKLPLYRETLLKLQRASHDNWLFREAFYDLCALHGLSDSPHVLRDAFRVASQREEETAMSYFIRMEALALPLVGLEDSGVPTLKSALKDVVSRMADQTNRARLREAIAEGDVTCFSTLRAAQTRLVQKYGEPAAKASKPRGRPAKEVRESAPRED